MVLASATVDKAWGRHPPEITKGWEVIEKVFPYVHAVCRIDNNRGSAVLIALPENSGPDVPVRAQSPLSLRYQSTSQEGPPFDTHRQGIRLKSTATTTLDMQPSMRNTQELLGRSGARGSRHMGVLLTTSFVLPSHEDACRSTATFLEQPVAGTAAQLRRPIRPLSVRVRSDYGFVTSVSQEGWQRRKAVSRSDSSCALPEFTTGESASDPEEEVGYVLTYCEVCPAPDVNEVGDATEARASVQGSLHKVPYCDNRWHAVPSGPLGGERASTSPCSGKQLAPALRDDSGFRPCSADDDFLAIQPLPLPLLFSTIPPVRVGDIHTMITHVNGTERRYVVQVVSRVDEEFCEYGDADPACEYSSGGPVFNLQGDFVGLQHQCGDQSMCILTSSIVRHLFSSRLLGMCRSPISSMPVSDRRSDACELAMGRAPRVHGAPNGTQPLPSIPSLGELGGQIPDLVDFQRAEEARGWLRPSYRVPSYEEVFHEYGTGNIASLCHMLHSFSYCSSLATLVLTSLFSSPYRAEIHTLSTWGGVGIVLELIDAYPHVVDLVTIALTVLSRVCLWEPNVSAFLRADGVITVLEIMKEYAQQPTVLQWGVYCMCQVTAPEAPMQAQTVELIVLAQGVELAVNALCVHGAVQKHRQLLAWLCTWMGNVVGCEPRCAAVLLRYGTLSVVNERLAEYLDDNVVLQGLLLLLNRMVEAVLRPLVDETPSDGTARVLEMLPGGSGGGSLSPTCIASLQLSAQLTERTPSLIMLLAKVLVRFSERPCCSTGLQVIHLCVDSLIALFRAAGFLTLAHSPSAGQSAWSWCETEGGDLLRPACHRVPELFPTEYPLLEKMKTLTHVMEGTFC